MKRFTTLALVILIHGLIAQNLPNTQRYLDKNKVKAKINTVNDKFWNINGAENHAYEVPVGTSRHIMFANSIWIGGLDANNQLHLSANTFKQAGTDVWPGPLDTANIAAFNSTVSAPYNRLWKIDCNDVNSFVTAYNNGSLANNTYTAPQDLLDYPAQGKLNFSKKLAPFYDANNNGTYDPLVGGDYPIIKGHQQILSIFNDQNGLHTETNAAPMGIEIHERSYAYSDPNIHDSMQVINYTTFYHYTIFNRSDINYHDVYICDWADVDLGYWIDDYIGCDTNNNFAYCYNANAFDNTGMGVYGYDSMPPVASHVLLPIDCSTDGIDNNQNGMIDEPGETFVMNSVTYYNNNLAAFNPVTTQPSTAAHYYNYMKGFWKDNSPFTYGGNGYGGTTPNTKVYPGDPENNTGWTESTAGNTPNDRRFLMSSGPFNFPAKSKIEWGYAIVFSRDTTQAVNTITQFSSRVQRDVRNVKQYDATHSIPQCQPQVVAPVGIKKIEKNLHVNLYPNPAKDFITIDLNQNVKDASVKVYDVIGKCVIQSSLTNGYSKQIDLSNIEKGIYFVEIESDGKKHVSKIIKG